MTFDTLTHDTPSFQTESTASTLTLVSPGKYQAPDIDNAEQPRLPVTAIDSGNNPRTEFPAETMASLVKSVIACGGVFTAILVRPKGDGRYEIVCGERRYRATCTAFGYSDDVTIPVTIRVLSDEEAERIALAENIDREKMTPLDEAEGAARVVASCGGSREKAAEALGWELPKLQRRLGLMYAIAEVRQALRDKKIDLGHAELLAGLRKESQAQGLIAISSKATRPTVAEFKAMLEQMALSLDAAIFDKADCAGCPHNAGTQQALFSVAIAGANCTNKTCYDLKSEAEVEKRAKALEADFQVVRIIRSGDNYSTISLQAAGAKGVGEEQAAACRTCKNFGAAVSAMPDSLGMAYRNQCFDTQCNVRMVSKRIREDAELAAATSNASNGKQAGGPAKVNRPEQKQQLAEKPVNQGNSRAVVEYREKVWRSILNRVTLDAQAADAMRIMLSLLLTRPAALSEHEAVKQLRELQIDIDANSPSGVLGKCMKADNDQLLKALRVSASFTNSTLQITEVTRMLKVLNVKMADHWVMTAEFLQLLTKNEIDALCAELGIKAQIGDSYSKVLAGKKDELIAAIMKVDTTHPFKGRVPKMMRW